MTRLRPSARILGTLLGVAAFGAAGAAQEVKRTELGRSPVSGAPEKEIVVQLVEIPPGATSGRHFHNGEEVFYVLQGGTVDVPGKGAVDRPTGEHGINKREVPHAGYTVKGPGPLKLLSVYVVDKDKPLQVPVP
jgi:quercetin dioxygenase-like cupin family protein